MRLQLRLLLAALLAAAALLVLARIGSSSGGVTAATPVPEPVPTAESGARERLLGSLRGRADRILVALRRESLPAGVAPVLLVQRGFLQLLAPPPPPAGPDLPVWPQAAILLPAPLQDLAPLDRAAFLDALAALRGGRSTLEGLTALDFELAPAELARLRRWLR